jgi:hypothetical protein
MNTLIQLREIDATGDVLASLGIDLKNPKCKRGLFLRGPVPLGWLARIDVAAHAAVLALTVKIMIDVTGEEPVVVPSAVWREWRLSKQQRKRALDALEAAGIVRVERGRGKAARIWLIDKP